MRRVQSEESYASIPDESLRECVKLAVTRARELDWPLFCVTELKTVDCFHAALPKPLADFLRGYVDDSFSHWPSGYSVEAGDPQINCEGIADVRLREVIERIIARAFELELRYFLNLCITPEVRAKRLLVFRAGSLPPDITAHLNLGFETAVFAKLATDPSKVRTSGRRSAIIGRGQPWRNLLDRFLSS